MSEQLYLLRLSAMNTCDECDLVPSAEFIVDADLGTDEFSAMDALQSLQRRLKETLNGAPVTNLRPMTREEIETWRDEES